MKQTTRGRKKLNDHIASYTNLVNKLLREISQVSTKDTSFSLEMYYSINDDSQKFFDFSFIVWQKLSGPNFLNVTSWRSAGISTDKS